MNRRRKTDEQDFQKAVATYLRLALPTPHAWFTAIPAGGGGKTRGAILKGMGYRAGTPDMLVISRRHSIALGFVTVVIWLELKTGRAGLSKAQEQCRDDLIAAGCQWALCRELADVERALRRFGVPLRATLGAEAA